MIREISSKDNPVVKKVRRLDKPSVSRREGLILVEGFRQVQEALEAGLQVEYVLITKQARQNKGWQQLEPWHEQLCDKSECLILTDSIFKSISGTDNPQGIALVCRAPIISASGQVPSETGLYLLLEEIQDPGNMGTIIRSADAFGFDAVIITSGCVWPFYDKALRSSMGSAFHIPIIEFEKVEQAVSWLQTSEVSILAADPNGINLTELRNKQVAVFQRPIAVIIGNEGSGLSDNSQQMADYLVRIPMAGQAESLNAGVAASIFCYELSCYPKAN